MPYVKTVSSVLLILSITVIAAAQQPGLNNSTHMKNYTQDSGAIAGVLTDAYFKGIYEGNVDLLGGTFYDGALLFGDVKGQPYYKTLAQYLDGVRNRQSPKDSGKPFKGEITGIDIVNSIAVARVRVRMYDFDYSELLSFHEINGKWLIVNKMISDISQ